MQVSTPEQAKNLPLGTATTSLGTTLADEMITDEVVKDALQHLDHYLMLPCEATSKGDIITQAAEVGFVVVIKEGDIHIDNMSF